MLPRNMRYSRPPVGPGYSINRRSPQALGLVGWWSPVGGHSIAVKNRAGNLAPLGGGNDPGLVPDPVLGQVFSFDGAADYYATGAFALPSLQQTTPFSVSFWFASTDADGPIFATAFFSVFAGIQIDINAGSIRGILINAAFSAGRIARTTSTGLASGALTHVVVTYSGNSSWTGWAFYINAVPAASTLVLDTTPGTLAQGNLLLGYNGASLFAGTVGDVRVYDRVIPAAVVSHIFNPQTRFDLYDRRAA